MSSVLALRSILPAKAFSSLSSLVLAASITSSMLVPVGIAGDVFAASMEKARAICATSSAENHRSNSAPSYGVTLKPNAGLVRNLVILACSRVAPSHAQTSAFTQCTANEWSLETCTEEYSIEPPDILKVSWLLPEMSIIVGMARPFPVILNGEPPNMPARPPLVKRPFLLDLLPFLAEAGRLPLPLPVLEEVLVPPPFLPSPSSSSSSSSSSLSDFPSVSKSETCSSSSTSRLIAVPVRYS